MRPPAVPRGCIGNLRDSPPLQVVFCHVHIHRSSGFFPIGRDKCRDLHSYLLSVFTLVTSLGLFISLVLTRVVICMQTILSFSFFILLLLPLPVFMTLNACLAKALPPSLPLTSRQNYQTYIPPSPPIVSPFGLAVRR